MLTMPAHQTLRSTARHAISMPTVLFAALALLSLGAAPARAQVGTIVIAHGGDSLWNALVTQVADQANTGGPVEVSFLMGAGAKTARFQDAVARLEAKGVSSITVVPMLVSSHSGHYDQIRWLAGADIEISETMHHHLHMAGIERSDTKLPIHVTPAMDDASQVAQVLTDRALAMTRAAGDKPSDRAVLIVGHGPNSAEDYASWMENLRRVADVVRATSGFRDVRVELVRDDAPAPVRAEAVTRVRELIELQAMVTGKDVIVVPVLVSKGTVSRDKVPADIKDTPSVYAGEPLLPHPAMARWIESRVRSAQTVSNR